MKRKKLMNDKKIDFKVLRTFNQGEWREWITSRMSGADLYGFPVGGTHARVEPSVYYGYVGDKIRRGRAFPEAEKAIVDILGSGKYDRIYSGYEQAEIFDIARNVTRPHRGYDLVAERVAKLLREREFRRATSIYKCYLIEQSLSLLSHMQRFTDKQFEDIYWSFLDKKPVTRLSRLERKMIARCAFIGLQVAYPLHIINTKAVRRILELNNGDERELEIVFRCLGKVLEDKLDFYIAQLNNGRQTN